MMYLYQVKDELDCVLTIAQTHEVIPGYEFLFTAAGEVDYNLLDSYIEKLYENFDAIIEDTAHLVQNLQAEAEMLKKEEDRLNARRKSAENRVAFLSDRLTNILKASNWNSLVSPLKIMFRNSEAVIVDNQSEIDSQFIKTEVVEKVDKMAIKRAIKAGQAVAGCHIEQRKNITIK